MEPIDLREALVMHRNNAGSGTQTREICEERIKCLDRLVEEKLDAEDKLDEAIRILRAAHDTMLMASPDMTYKRSYISVTP